MSAPAEPTVTEAAAQHQSAIDAAKDAARKVLGISTGTAGRRWRIREDARRGGAR